ncbi:MAG: InlB B-repeat-containing protein, partial [Paludibacteraceae bacterium]|nr:InlB B-repeat-containing protein [Paludibacteraceae bacterium]
TETAVTLNPNGGAISDDKWRLEDGVYKLTTEDESITLPTITRTGYTFGGWATPSGGSYDANDIIPLDGTPVTLDAIWTANKYSITYKDQGNVDFSGTHETGYPTQHTYGTETTLKGATKTGYTFDGWYKEAACTNIVTTLGATAYTSDITLYAKWTEKTLTNYRTFCDVVCDAYSFHTGTGEKETWLKEAIECFTKEGGYEHEWQIKNYIVPADDKFFVGNYGYFYNDNLGIGGDNGKSRSVVSDWGNMYLAPAMDENDALGTPRLGHAKGAKGTLRIFEDSNWDNLFVGFIPDGYKLKFGNEEYTFAMHNEGDREYRSEVVLYNSTNTDKNVSVGIVGADGKYVATNHTQEEMRHIFLNTGGTSYWEADNVDNFALYDITHETFTCLMHKTGYPNIYEGWVPTTCAKIIFVRLKSSTIDWSNIHNQTVDITLDADKNLYTINNWNQSDNKSGGAWSVYERYGQFAMHDNSKSKNWYVHFVPHYVLTYNKNADDATGTMDIQTVAVDATNKGVVVADCGFTRPGYEFKNWRKDNTSTYYAPNGSNSIELSADITLYAQWTAKKITITWEANGGSVTPTSSTYTYNGATITPPTPTRANYIFNGWFTAATDGTKITDVGTTNKPTDDVTYYAQWTEKATPTFAWSAATCTAALEADNTFPTLSNPNNLDVTYSSSKTDIAKIDENGDVILGAVGETEITATGAETATHKSATTTYKLIVVESNCKWVEVTDNATLEDGDEVVITMCKDEFTWTISNTKNTSTAPAANDITANIQGNYLTTVSDEYKWVIEKNNANLTFYSYSDNANYLYCTNADNGVRVGTGTAKVFVVDGNYLKNIETTSPRYVGISFNTNPYTWRCYTGTTGVIANETLKFYKRECLDSEHYWVTWDAGEGLWTDGSSKKLESYLEGATITEPAAPSREGYRFDGWTPAPTTMPAKNTTFTAVWTKVYKVTWYENGVPSYTYVPSDNAVVTWEDNIADCGKKKFYGWTADDTFVSDPTTPPALISKGTTIAGDVTYYAVYADAEVPANPGYTKVTTISEGTYLIATDATTGKAYTGKSGSNTYGGYCDVTISHDVISKKPDNAVEVTVTLGTGTNAGKFAIYDGTYYLSAPNGNSITFNNNVVYDWNLTNDGYIHSNGQSTRYLQYNSSSPRFACYTGTQKYAYLYKKQTTTYKNFAVSCATYAISVTTSTGGTVTTTPADEAGAGQEITINVTPADCKYLTALKYNDGSDHSINIASTPYTFTMPAADVTVTATFADKIATDIEILTSAHRMLMQGSAFVGEQVRITYNNGDKETLNWNDSRLTFTGHNTATLGSQTVTVTYNDCGTQSASYNIEVIDGLGITFWDGDYTETIKYEPGDLVDVDNRIGQNICSGWEFAGWSETKVANESEEYVPVHNFNATDAKVLYAVYVKKKAQWTTIVTADEAKSGAKYVLAYDRYGTYYALTSSVKDVNYLAGKVVTSTEGELNSFDVYYLSAEPTADLIWELVSTGENGKWYLYNKNTAKYIDLSTQGQIHLTDLPSDKLQMESGYNDSQIRIASSTVPTYYLSWDNSNTRYNTYASSNSQEYWYTKDEEFTSTPPCSPLSATFHGNGGIVTDGVNSGDNLTITEPTRDAGITTPTASFEDCNGKTWTFVGWAREEIDVTRVPVLTTDLLHDGGGNKHYKIQEDGEEFWAVFTNTGDSETKYGTITFTDDDVTRQYENAKTITKSVTAMGDYDFELYHVSNASSLGIQFDHDNATRGYIKNITSLGKINSISLNDFQTGDINDVKVYVGNMPNAINTLLTEADLQQTGNTYTYYPSKNYAYVKIEATGYCGITSISIDFGKGTQIWATTPNCSDIFLSGNELYVTSTNGQSIRAAERLTVNAVKLESKAKVVISSNSSDIYFSDVQDANFTQAVKPTETLTLTTDVDGNLAATEIYVHYRPSVDGTGIPEDVVVSANLETPNPSITDDHTIHVRNLPADFVIAAKWDGHWYALPANCTSSQSPTEGLLIEVDNIDNPKMAIAAPASAKFGLKSVYTSNSTNDRYEKNGANLVFVENVTEETPVANQTLYNGSETGIQVYAQYANYHTGNALRYEWTPTTTNLLDYTLTSAHTFTKKDGTPEEARTISLGNNGVFGTLLNDKSYNGEVRLLPATFYEPAPVQVLKWKANSVIVMYTGTETTATTQVGNNAKSAEQTLAKQQLTHGIYELTTNLALTSNAGGALKLNFGENTRVELEIPLIISGDVTVSANAHDVVILENSKLIADATKYSYKDVYVYGGAKLAIPTGTALGVNNIILRAGGVATDGAGQNATYQYIYPQVELKGTLTSSVQNIRYEYVTDYDHWYHLALPFDGSLASIHYPYEYYGDQVKLDNTGSWQIKRYDGATRATGNYDAWKDIEKDEPKATTVTAGKGYIYWGAPKKITANDVYDRPTWGIQRITMSVSAPAAKTAENEDKTVSGLSSHEDVATSVKDNDQGWNLIGNPYMVNLTGLNSQSLQIGQLIHETDASGNWTGKWHWDDTSEQTGLRYVTIPSDHFDTYTAGKMTETELVAGRSFFVQIAGAATDLVFDVNKKASLMPALLAENSDKPVDIETGIILSNETMQDEVNFWIKDGKTNDYEYNADYPKTPNNNQFNIYGVHTNGDLSWVATGPEYAEESMPIGYQVPAAGTYILSVSETYYSEDLQALYVTDHAMSPELTVDLMNAPYEFSVNQAETNNERFTVSLKLKSENQGPATGLENIGVQTDGTIKFIYHDKIFILHNGTIYDATGKQVTTINK